MASKGIYSRSHVWERVLGFVLLPVLALAIAGGLALIDTDAVENKVQLREAAFGLPFDWLVQDQSPLDPSFPYDASPERPQDYETTAKAGPLLADAGIVLAAEELIFLSVIALRRTRRGPG